MDAQDRARKIVDTAVELAEQGGFEAVRLRDVASQAGVALGTLYRHFRSKEDLLVAALNREVEGLVRQMNRNIPSGDQPLERVTEYFQSATHAFCRKPKLARAVLRAAASGVPELTEKMKRFHDLCATLAVSALRGKRLNGDAPSELEMTTSSVLHQVWFASLIGWMGGLNSEAQVVDEVHQAAQLLLRGADGNW